MKSIEEVEHLLQGRFLKKAPLAEYTSWRVGGPADYLYIPANLNDLSVFLKALPQDIPLLWLGLGSNVLIRDGGIEGAVIITQGACTALSQLDHQTLRAEAGVACGQLARYSARLNLTGLEFLAGIPGTVGGALRMNAGCYGGETWDHTIAVEVMNRAGEIKLRDKKDFKYGYRHVETYPDEWFVAGHFVLQSGKKEQALKEIRELLEKRNAAQPTGLPNCGSVFRNPAGNFAAKLIEQCGLKGKKLGGASVSTKHANFIINDGDARAADIENLITEVAAQVEAQHGVRLIREVCIMGKV